MNYRTVLRRKDPDRVLYLAVPKAAYDDFFKRQFTQLVIQDYQLSIAVYDIEKEVIFQWLP